MKKSLSTQTLCSVSLFLLMSTGFTSFMEAQEISSQKDAKTTWAEKLGYPAGSKVIILHADDAGMSEGANIATAHYLANNLIQSAAIMAPCPSADEFIRWAIDHPDKDDDMWIYLPALRKTRRIVSSEKSKSYMGSEFSNADMSKPNIDDFNYELLGSATHESVDCWRVASIPKDENIEDKFGFSKKITLIDKQNYRVKKIDFYDLNRELHKVMVFSDYEELGPGKALAKKMEIENLQNNRRSVLTMDKIQVGSNLDENTFTVGMLEK